MTTLTRQTDDVASPREQLVVLPTARTGHGRQLRVPRGLERLAGVLLLLVIWQILSSIGVISPDVLSSPIAVCKSGWQLIQDGTLPSAVWVSLQRVLIGLAVGVTIGLALALAGSVSRIGDDIIDAPMQALRFVPVIGLQSLVIVWFGIGDIARISLVVFGVVFPIYINTYAAVRNLDPKYVELAQTVELKHAQVIRRIVLPGALPGFLTGLRMATATAWLMLVFAEQINATNGIGYLISRAQTFFETDTIIVGLAAYAVLGLISDGLVRLFERKALRWMPGR